MQNHHFISNVLLIIKPRSLAAEFFICVSILSVGVNVYANEMAAKNMKSSQADNPQSWQDFIKKSTLDGYIRSYYFSRQYATHTKVNQSAFSLGGALNIKTAPIYNMSAGASYYAADPLGLNSSHFNNLDSTLPGQSVNVLGQAYLQYQVPTWLLRYGDQIIKTPWLNDADSRMIPATYQAILTTISPIAGLDLTLFRQFRYKSRTSKNFDKSNLYDPNNFGGTPSIKQLTNESILGTLAGGAKYQWASLVTQAWYYKFYDFANLLYADVNYIFKSKNKINPIIGVQLAREWGDGKNILNTLGQGRTDSTVFGGLVGLEIYEGQLTLGYNDIPKTRRAFQYGDIVSPYTTGYTSDPLYTTSMIAGLIEKSSGHAFKVSGNYLFFDKQLKLAASFAKYYTQPALNNTNEANTDITYTFKTTALKGLSLRYRLGILNGNPATGRFVYNRLMLQYDFA